MPFLYTFGRYFSFSEIFASDAAFLFVAEAILKEFIGPDVETGYIIRVGVILGFGFIDGFFSPDFDTGALGESLNGLDEGEIFAHLDKAKDISAGTAGEAFEDLLSGIYVKTGTVVFVERA